MVRVSGFAKSSTPMVKSVSLPGLTLKDFGADVNSVMDSMQDSKRADKTFGNAERPSNIWFRMNGQTEFWLRYKIMDWYRSEVSVLSTIITRSVSELFRYDLELKPKGLKSAGVLTGL